MWPHFIASNATSSGGASTAVTVVVSVLSSTVVGGAITALIAKRSQRSQQFREALLVASGIFADAAVQVIDALKDVRPPSTENRRNQGLLSNPSECSARLVKCADKIQQARAATGRIRILCGPESMEAAAAQSFYYHSNEAYKVAKAFWETRSSGDDVLAGPDVYIAFRKERTDTWKALDDLGRGISKRVG
jgi:hypothetical protein